MWVCGNRHVSLFDGKDGYAYLVLVRVVRFYLALTIQIGRDAWEVLYTSEFGVATGTTVLKPCGCTS